MKSSPLDEETIYQAARELSSPEARIAFLKHACGDDQALFERVQALLRVAEEETGFLAVPAFESHAAHSLISEGPGAVIGPYKLLEQLGEGGFGVVFLAEQAQPIRRKVAMKILKVGMDTRQVVARFEAERQALAIMDHPNIARVFDGGATASGRPYVVMEFVKGVPITEFCDQHRLSPRERLELFISVCHAVQHAHQKGIIHRDLKPSNILVSRHDTTPVVKVIDFGVAKALGPELTDKTLFTGVAQMIGTPLYMSPEQAGMSDLDIDTRSDIYSLGVLLYELLAGTTPFAKERFQEAAYDEIRRIIREEEPPTPSSRLSQATETLPSIAASRGLEPGTLSGVVRGELDWIVMKALEKDRNRRYETANGFAIDLQRYLAGEAVSAVPPNMAYRIQKFVRRHRGPVVAASLVLLSLIAGVVGTSWGLFHAKAAAAREAKAKERAEQAEDSTLAEFRASTDDAIEQLIGSKPELGTQEKTYLENTLTRWRAFANRSGGDQRSRLIRAEGHSRVGILWHKLGRLSEARSEYDAAQELLSKLAAESPEVPAHRNGLAQVHVNKGFLLGDLNEHEAAKREYSAACDLLQPLTTHFPDVPRYQLALAKAHGNLGAMWITLGENRAAKVEFEAARGLLKALVQKFADDPLHRFELAVTQTNLGIVMSRLREWDSARSELDTARELLTRLCDQHADAPKYVEALAKTHLISGRLLRSIENQVAARQALEQARDLQKRLCATYPNVPQYHLALARTDSELSLQLEEAGDRNAARKECEAARNRLKGLNERFPNIPSYQHELARSLNNLGHLLSVADDVQGGRTEHEAARELLTNLVAKHPDVPGYQQDLATTHHNLGSVLAYLNKPEAAKTECEASVELRKKLVERFPGNSRYRVELAGEYCNFGILLHNAGRPKESVNWFNQAIDVLEPLHRADSRDATTRQYLRNSHWRRAMANVAIANHSEAVKDWGRAAELSPPADRQRFRYERVKSQLQLGQVAEALNETAELTKSANWNAGALYDFACVYSVASGKFAEKKRQYADRAMELLRQAVKAGWNDAAHINEDGDLVGIRSRDDFKKLVEDLEAPNKRR